VISRAIATAGFVAALVLLGAAPAHGNAVTTGDCRAEGTWEGSGQVEKSEDLAPGEVITIPRKDTVDWVASLDDHQPGDEVPARRVSGSVQIEIGGTGQAIDVWESDSTKAANSGSYHYNLPSVLVGIEMPLRGQHFENGELVCEGNIVVVVEGSAFSNPLTFGGIAGLLIFGVMLIYSGRPVYRPAKAGGRRPRRGHPWLGAVAGFFFCVSALLVMLPAGVIDLGSLLVTLLPLAGIVVGVLIGLVAPFGRVPEGDEPETPAPEAIPGPVPEPEPAPEPAPSPETEPPTQPGPADPTGARPDDPTDPGAPPGS
jgi:hypothetical protein